MDAPPTAPPATRSSGRTAATLLFGAALGAAAVLLAGWIDRTPADPHDAPAFVGQSARSFRPTGHFRFVTWNVHQRESFDVADDPAAEWLNGYEYDVAVLQEASRSGIESLRSGAGVAAAFVGTERRFRETHVGNAVLSELPTGPVHRVPLPDTRGKAFRTMVLTTVFVPTEQNPAGEAVRVLNVHLTEPNLEPGQIERAIDLFLALETPCVLAGDFNQPIDAPALTGLLAVEGVTDALAALDPEEVLASLPVDKEKVDHIFVRGLTVGEAAVVPTKASDHPLYRVDLRVPRAAPPTP